MSLFKLSSIVLVLFTLMISGCGGGDETTQAPTQSSTGVTLKLTLDTNALEVDTNTTLQVVATYDQGVSSEDVTDKVEWVINDKDALEIKKHTLHTKKDKLITIQAKYKNTLSNPITIEIYKIINGHRLPPEPDETLNNSTLLGIDSNNNGVRDDVERWIYKNYKDKHPIYIDIAMQEGKAYNQLLNSSLQNTEQAKKIHEKCIAPIACKAYYQIYAKYFNEPLLVTEDVNVKYFQNFYFNTQNRKNHYSMYSKLLSGYMYSTPKLGEGKNLCDFNTSKYEK
ncbi:MAG: hypothetical protein ABXS93_09320 [Sulfurimonas sp.]